MPAVITHYLFAKTCVDSIGDTEVLKSVEQHRDIFYLGAQGPDILFFALGDKTLNQLGERMHHEGINGFFAECINRIRKTAAHDGRYEIIAYVTGFICHYALDTCTHPYIYYKTGFSDVFGNITGESEVRHHFLETTIDCILSEKIEEMNPYLLNIVKKITIEAKKRALIGKFLSETVQLSYDTALSPDDYVKAMRDMAFVYRVLRDKSGRKRAILYKLGKVFRYMESVASLVHYAPVERLDYLNEQRNEWSYPWDVVMDMNFSFMDLFNRAIEDSRIYINAFAKAINKQLDDKRTLSILGSKNFSTGLESPVEFRYYSIDFEKLKKE